MMAPGRLPVAPRPYRDELLSSWLARVACRYGLTAPDLAGFVAAGGRGPSSPLPIDDRAPARDQIREWAQACGVDPDRLHRLSLSRRYPERPRSWYLNRGSDGAPSVVSGSTPVCRHCLAADHAAGREGYLRAGWMLAERCICPVHRRLLEDRCLGCHRHLSVTFRLLEGGARPVCRWCGLMVADQGGKDARPEDPALVGTALGIQQEITVRVNQAASERAGIEMALAALWAPLDHPAAARPVLALWFGGAGWRCPYEVRHGVGAGAPLGQLPVRWRLVTLLALSEVFGLDPRRDGVLPPVAAHLVRRAAPRPVRVPRAPATGRVLTRAPADYMRLARQILADPCWIAADQLPKRQRQGVHARLIDAALAGPRDLSGPGPLIARELAPGFGLAAAVRRCRIAGVYETGDRVISMTWRCRHCETDSSYMRLATVSRRYL
jgi:hypothetical protein